MTTDRHDTYEDDIDDLLDDPVLAGLLTQVRDLADHPAPTIGADLAAVLGGVTPLAPARARRSSRAASVVVIGLVSAGVLTGGISAAAADELPDPVQRVVARVINTITPFEIPDRDRREPSPGQAPSQQGPAQPNDQVTLPPIVDPPTAPGPKTSADPSNDVSNEPSEAPLAQSGEQSTEQDADESTEQSTEQDADESTGARTRDEGRGDVADEDRDHREDRASSSEGPDQSSGDEND